MIWGYHYFWKHQIPTTTKENAVAPSSSSFERSKSRLRLCRWIPTLRGIQEERRRANVTRHGSLCLLCQRMVSLNEIEALLKMLVDVKPYHVQVELDRLRVELVDLKLVLEVFKQRQAAAAFLRRR